jgi:2-methylisocitrate lyase-like PEP mutase family enzyme
LRGINDLDDTIKRLQAYESVGASVLYAPGIKSLDELRKVTGEINRPFNVLAVFFHGVSVPDFVDAGAKRISVGGALAWASVKPIIEAGRQMLEQGNFNWTGQMASGAEIKTLLNS